MSNEYGSSEVTFEILEHIGVLETFSTGWRKELNLVSWNGAAGKYDIREWSPDHEMMSRGITIKENEMRILLEVMRRRRGSARRMEDRPGPVKVTRSTDAPTESQAATHGEDADESSDPAGSNESLGSGEEF